MRHTSSFARAQSLAVHTKESIGKLPFSSLSFNADIAFRRCVPPRPRAFHLPWLPFQLFKSFLNLLKSAWILVWKSPECSTRVMNIIFILLIIFLKMFPTEYYWCPILWKPQKWGWTDSKIHSFYTLSFSERKILCLDCLNKTWSTFYRIASPWIQGSISITWSPCYPSGRRRWRRRR